MAQAKPTARQAEIKRLLAGDVPVGEIARLQKTSAQAVYSQISRMRALGILPKSTRKSGSKAGRRAASKGRTRHLPNGSSAEVSAQVAGMREQGILPPEEKPANGNVSLEDHMAQELERVVRRLAEIEAATAALTSEQGDLTERKSRLEAANSHLTGAAKQPARAEQPVSAEAAA